MRNSKSSNKLEYSDGTPSEVTEVFWLRARRKQGEYPSSTDRSGKWLIFERIDRIDETWARIKKATEDGLLGAESKVATARPNPNATRPETRVILE